MEGKVFATAKERSGSDYFPLHSPPDNQLSSHCGGKLGSICECNATVRHYI